MTTYKEYKKEINDKNRNKKDKKDEVDDNKNQEWSNLTEEEKRGLKKLKKRIANDEIVLVKTDKSGKMSIMEKDKYLSMGLKGNSMDKPLSRSEVKKIEKRLNNHSRMICKILNAALDDSCSPLASSEEDK